MVTQELSKKSKMQQAKEKVGLFRHLDLDTGRQFEAGSVPLDQIEPKDGQKWVHEQDNPKATYLKDWEKLLIKAETGEELPHLLLEKTGEKSYKMNPSPLGGDLGNSLALLTALRSAGKRHWPAVLVTEPINKEYDENQHPRDEHGRWIVSGVDHKKLDAYQDKQLKNNKELLRAKLTYISGGKGGFKDINKDLRAGLPNKTADILEANMVSFKDLNSELGGDGHVYRGITSAGALGLKNGDTAVELGLMSTSFDYQEAVSFATQRQTGAHMVMRITPDPSLKCILGHTGQQEVTFERNVRLTVTSQRENVVAHSEYPGEHRITLVDVKAEKA